MQHTLKPYNAPSIDELNVSVEQGFIVSAPSSTLDETISETDLNESSEDFWG